MPPPKWTLQAPDKTTMDYIYKVAEQDDVFDKAKLKQECGKAIRNGEATVLRCVSEFGELILISLNKDPTKPLWNVWWRSIRLLLTPRKQVRILLFGHPSKRIIPHATKPITEVHVNGGSTMPCDPQAIAIYRKEEMTRVLIHELFHASCSDPYHKTTPFLEADTEAWAELVLCAMAAKGQLNAWVHHMKQQLQWAVRQAATIQTYHKVQSPDDYAWRYLVGRLDVWAQLGIPVPPIPTKFTPTQSLRFSVCEPDNL
jgi:hypothetical protein